MDLTGVGGLLDKDQTNKNNSIVEDSTIKILQCGNEVCLNDRL